MRTNNLNVLRVGLFVMMSGGMLAACDKAQVGQLVSSSPANTSAETVFPTGIALVTANTDQCAAGGIVVVTYRDMNSNSQLDGSDTILTTIQYATERTARPEQLGLRAATGPMVVMVPTVTAQAFR